MTGWASHSQSSSSSSSQVRALATPIPVAILCDSHLCSWETGVSDYRQSLQFLDLSAEKANIQIKVWGQREGDGGMEISGFLGFCFLKWTVPGFSNPVCRCRSCGAGGW